MQDLTLRPLLSTIVPQRRAMAWWLVPSRVAQMGLWQSWPGQGAAWGLSICKDSVARPSAGHSRKRKKTSTFRCLLGVRCHQGASGGLGGHLWELWGKNMGPHSFPEWAHRKDRAAWPLPSCGPDRGWLGTARGSWHLHWHRPCGENGASCGGQGQLHLSRHPPSFLAWVGAVRSIVKSVFP
jgi:hypothetical protein